MGLELHLLWLWAPRSARIASVMLVAMMRVVGRWAMRSDRDE